MAAFLDLAREYAYLWPPILAALVATWSILDQRSGLGQLIDAIRCIKR